ncbi:MAG: hypothetical protein NXI30_09490 [bacterium]|nr:hypothetical protein [bacterium]
MGTPTNDRSADEIRPCRPVASPMRGLVFGVIFGSGVWLVLVALAALLRWLV